MTHQDLCGGRNHRGQRAMFGGVTRAAEEGAMPSSPPAVALRIVGPFQKVVSVAGMCPEGAGQGQLWMKDCHQSLLGDGNGPEQASQLCQPGS